MKSHQSYNLPLATILRSFQFGSSLLSGLEIGTYFQSQRRLNALSIGKSDWSLVFIVAQIYRFGGNASFLPLKTSFQSDWVRQLGLLATFRPFLFSSSSTYPNCPPSQTARSTSASMGYVEYPDCPSLSSSWNRSPNICAQLPRFISSMTRTTFSVLPSSEGFAISCHALTYAFMNACGRKEYSIFPAFIVGLYAPTNVA